MADTAFGRMFQRTAARTLLRQFGEPVTYYPADGVPRSLMAIVERQALEVIGEIGDQVGEAIIVRILNDQSEGVLATKVDAGGDEIALSSEVGARKARRAVVRIMSDANGFISVLCQ